MNMNMDTTADKIMKYLMNLLMMREIEIEVEIEEIEIETETGGEVEEGVGREKEISGIEVHLLFINITMQQHHHQQRQSL